MPTAGQQDELKLAFSRDVISQECHSWIPEGFELRPLALTDYERGFSRVLSCLIETPDVGQEAWKQRFEAMVAASNTYYPIVIISQETDQIVAMGTALIELKFFKGLTRVAHVEDIVVDTSLHSKGFGKIIMQTIIKIAEHHGVSNIILNCGDDHKAFYEKCGFTYSGLQMSKKYAS